jgi:hypothetical protein
MPTDLERRASSLSPGSVLEIAAGTGVVTRALAPLLPQEASYVVTDLKEPILAFNLPPLRQPRPAAMLSVILREVCMLSASSHDLNRATCFRRREASLKAAR